MKKSTNKIFYIFTLICLFTLNLQAQRDYRWEKEYEPSPPIPAEFQNEDAVIIYSSEERQSRVTNNQPFTRDVIKRRYKILTQKGLEDYTRFNVRRRRRMGVEILDARTLKKSGEVVDLEAKEIKELEYNAEKDLKNKDEYLLFSVPGVEVGDEVEIIVTYEGNTLRSGGNVFLHQDLPTLKSEFKLFVDEKIIIYQAAMNGMSEPIVERPIDHYSFTWKAENLPGLYDSSNTIPGNTLPYFIYEFDYARFYGTLPPPTPKDWRELVLQITENLDIRKNPKKFDALMKEILGDKINASKVEQATFLHNYFNENITLKRLEEKEKSGYLETYFKTKVADWSALVSMYEAAFDWLDVNYYFGTARSKYLGPILLTFPTGYQITDYFFAIEDEKLGTYLYVPKEENIQWQANEIPAHLRGTRVYMLSLNDKETLKQIDFQNNRFNQNQLLFKGNADINLVDGTMTHSLQESVTGEISTRYRDRVYTAHKNEKLAENATKKWQNLIPEAKVSNVKLSDYPTTSPYKYNIDFAIDTPNQISEIEAGTYKVQFGNCLNHNILQVKDHKRLLDYHPNYTFLEAYNYVVTFAGNAKLQNKENIDLKVDNEIGTFELLVNQIKPDMLSVRSRYILKVNSIAPEKMPLLFEINKAAEAAGQAELILVVE